MATPSVTRVATPSASERKYAARKSAMSIAANIAAIVVCFIMIFPVFSTLVLSFKQQADVIRTPPQLFPCDTPTETFNIAACRFFTEGYQRIIDLQPKPGTLFGVEAEGRIINTYLPNTIFYAVFGGLMVTVLAGMAGYVFSRYQFRGKQYLLIAVLAITGIPLLTNLLALYQIVVDLRKATGPFFDQLVAGGSITRDASRLLRDWQDRIVLVGVYIGFFLPLSIWIVKGFFDAIPRELEEAAFIDGASPFQALMRVITPLAMPGLLAAFLLTFVSIWNEFIANYLIVGTSKQNLRGVIVGVYDLTGANLVNYQVLAAACVLVMLPVILVFLFARRSFFQAMIEGAVKG
jgi:ABC-type glycerol-3-phosphate transport system permease component